MRRVRARNLRTVDRPNPGRKFGGEYKDLVHGRYDNFPIPDEPDSESRDTIDDGNSPTGNIDLC
jgi:hypothetical protein